MNILKLASMGLLAAGLLASSVSAKEVTIRSAVATPVMASGKTQTTFIRVALTGAEIDSSVERVSANVAIVLDKSGSMRGQKIKDAKEAAIMAVSRLNGGDTVSIVTYDDSVEVIVPATAVDNKNRIYGRIDGIRANGGTALFAGVSKGAKELRQYIERNQVSRVILLSDGIANVGPSSPNELGRLGMSLAKEGISVTTIGLGLGYNEDLMTQLANYSDGNHVFVENSRNLASVFERELGDVFSVVAQEVDIEIFCREGIKPIRLLGRNGEIIGNKVYTKMNQLYSAQEKYVVLEVEVPAQDDGNELPLAGVNVTYKNVLDKQRYNDSSQIVASFSASQDKVESAVDKRVYESAVEQVANEQNDKAIRLRDEGKVKEAQAVLEESSLYLQGVSEQLDSAELRKQSEEAKQDAVSLDDEGEWNKNRKILKEKVYKRSNQQSY